MAARNQEKLAPGGERMKEDPRPMKKPLRGVSNGIDLGIPSDVFGSYTGVPLDDEIPVQDADDL